MFCVVAKNAKLIFCRDEIWGHSQYVQNKVSKRKITRKAGGEEVVEEVDEQEEEEYVLLVVDLNVLELRNPICSIDNFRIMNMYRNNFVLTETSLQRCK